MIKIKDLVIGAVVKFLSAISSLFVRPAVQRIPVRNHLSIQRKRR